MSLVFGRRGGMVVGLLTLTLGALAGLGLTHSGLFPRTDGLLTARIVDDSTGAPLAARAAVMDVNGRPLQIAGMHERVQQFGKRWYYNLAPNTG